MGQVRPDGYYGDVATGYDASRSAKPKWRNEITAVREFVTDGPVLDVPFGTGRFAPIYKDKGLAFTGIDISSDMLAIARSKCPGADIRQGSVYDIDAGAYGTAVCVRFLEWLPVWQAKAVLGRLAEIASSVVASINHGVEGHPDAYTYDFGKFLQAIDGLMIEARRVTADVNGITSEIFKLRPATWADVLAQFAWEHDDPAAAVQRIADKHAAFVKMKPVDVSKSKVRAEYWNGEQIGAVVESLSEYGFIVGNAPLRLDPPLTLLERDGMTFILDGRHRANVLMKSKGPHPVLVLRC
jgi:SAM-dependent methyltransferase